MGFLENRIPDPQLRIEIHELVNSHQRLTSEPLLLALFYDPHRDRHREDIFIFEVIDGFGANMVDPDGDIFEVEFGSSASVDMHLPAGAKVHLVLTNPVELSAACEQGWMRVREVLDAISHGEFEILHEDSGAGGALLKQLLPPEAAE